MLLNIITITKDDYIGLKKNLESTKKIRETNVVRQIIIDSSELKTKKENLELIKSEDNIEYIYQEPKGITAAFNLGIEKSDEGWLWFLNSGDYIYPDLDIELFINVLKASSSKIIVFKVFFQNLGVSEPVPHWLKFFPIANWCHHPCTLIKKDVFNEIGFFNKNLEIAADYEFMFRIIYNNYNIDILSMPISVFNLDGESSKNYKRTSRENIIVINRYFFKILFKLLVFFKYILKFYNYNFKTLFKELIKR